ncbi:MAG: hypothetical protein WC208_15970, partial [Gallionella sp.]
MWRNEDKKNTHNSSRMPDNRDKKKTSIMPSTRAERAINNLGDSRSKKEAMMKAGYTESYAEAGQIQHTDTWQQLMDKYIPDTKLAEVHSEGLEATRDDEP